MPGRSRPPRSDSEEEAPTRPPVPGTVTSIKPQVRDPERVSLFIDGAFSLGLDRTVADTLGIVVGRHLDEAALAEILSAEELAKATNTALAFLAWRPRSEGEIIRRLKQGNYPEATIAQVMTRLREWRYVDDEDFARRWVENRTTHRPRGARLLTQELRSKGVDPEVASQVIDEAEIDEYAGALDIASKRFSQMADLESDVRNRRMVGFLSRRGYGFDIIRRVLEHLESDPGEDDFAENH